jgi:two-component system, cell cycle response regulator DivK
MSSMRIAATRRKQPPPTPPEKATGTRRAIKADILPSILIVDDAEDNRALYAEYLEFFGLCVAHAVDGEHALLKVMRVQPDLVVMDLAMPVLDGWEATRLIKTHPKTKQIPVIAITGHTAKENLKRARAVGADVVLTKPCSPESLLMVIRELLARVACGAP